MDKIYSIGHNFCAVPVIEEPEEVTNQRIMKNQRKRKIAKSLGVDYYVIDGGLDRSIFKNKEEEEQYFIDTISLSRLIDEDKPIPKDLKERLLIIKNRREKLKKG